MGTINYRTSNYITIGYNCNNIDYEEYEWSIETIEELYNTINEILKNNRFYYFHVTLQPGYYEGFTVDIESNFSYCFDDYCEKLQALKEITQIKLFLIECVKNYGLRSVSPGWVTSYATETRSLININDAIKEMRSNVRITPTWSTLPKDEWFA